MKQYTTRFWAEYKNWQAIENPFAILERQIGKSAKEVAIHCGVGVSHYYAVRNAKMAVANTPWTWRLREMVEAVGMSWLLFVRWKEVNEAAREHFITLFPQGTHREKSKP